MLQQVLNGRYRIDSKIGEGGFGSVYRGVELASNRKVALKLLHPQMTRDTNLVARFRREGHVAISLRDPHTITTYEFDQTPEGTLYIAMELLEGKSLNQLFKEEQRIAWPRMFKIMLELCSSLGEAHAMGIVHRDLKPDNVYLEARPGNPEFVKVLDFGMAKIVGGEGAGPDPNAAKLTAMGQTLGTLEYMSPEQLMGAAALDARSDIYALGVLMFEMITGQLPFPNIKQPVALMMAQLKETPPAPSSVHPTGNIPPDADALILRCLDKTKTNRFDTVGQLAAAIEALIGPRPAPQMMQPHVAAAPGGTLLSHGVAIPGHPGSAAEQMARARPPTPAPPLSHADVAAQLGLGAPPGGPTSQAYATPQPAGSASNQIGSPNGQPAGQVAPFTGVPQQAQPVATSKLPLLIGIAIAVIGAGVTIAVLAR